MSTSIALATPAWPSDALQSSQFVAGKSDDIAAVYVGMLAVEFDVVEELDGDD